ncbi:MAG: hypothetical protein MHM6MM_004105 [Cercozoa sp. M6MM]
MSTRRKARRAVLTLTDAAAKRIKTLAERKNDPSKVVRLGVRARGCNGFSYALNYISRDEIEDDFDEVVKANDGTELIVDGKAVFYVLGTVMDWVEDDLRAEFLFTNPNATGECGCGESFTVDGDRPPPAEFAAAIEHVKQQMQSDNNSQPDDEESFKPE